jgi:hypothetical protein
MVDKKISQLPIGNILPETIFPIVSSGITSQTTFADIQNTISGSSLYIRGWENEGENGNSITIGHGLGKITLTNGSDQIIGIGGANFDGDNIGSIGYNGQFTVILSDGSRRYVTTNPIDSTHRTIALVYLDNKQLILEGTSWINLSGDYDYYPYFIPEAISDFSYGEGNSTLAGGNSSHAEGYNTTASGNYSHVEGYGSTASGYISHAEGQNTQANGQASHAEGSNTQGIGYASHAEGSDTQAIGYASHAGGYQSQANGDYSFVHGYNSQANGNYSIVLGQNLTGNTADTTYVDNFNIKTLGSGTSVTNLGLDASGFVVSGTSGGGTSYWSAGTGSNAITTLNGGNISSGSYSVAEGSLTIASGNSSHAEGSGSTANGQASHAEGNYTTANGQASHAEGNNTTASGYFSHAEGAYSLSFGPYSHAEGNRTIASGNSSHAEGFQTTANGLSTHAEGSETIASGNYSHVGGSLSIANGLSGFVHGSASTVNGNYSVVLGRGITGNTADTTYVDNFNIKQILSLNVTAAPVSPIDGQVWLESNTNTGLKIRINGVTKTITLT